MRVYINLYLITQKCKTEKCTLFIQGITASWTAALTKHLENIENFCTLSLEQGAIECTNLTKINLRS